MKTGTCLFFVALICTTHCTPLGQKTVCESTQTSLPGVPPVNEVSTMCESAANLLPYYGFGLQAAALTPGAALAPAFYNGFGFPYGLPHPGIGSETVCETTPNVLGLGGFGALNTFNPIGWPLGLPYGLPNVGTTTVSGNTPNLLSLGSLGHPYPPVPVANGLGTSTVCETSPNVGLNPLGLPLGDLSLNRLGLGLARVPFL